MNTAQKLIEINSFANAIQLANELSDYETQNWTNRKITYQFKDGSILEFYNGKYQEGKKQKLT